MEVPFNKIRKIGKSGDRREIDHDFGFGHVSPNEMIFRWSCQIGRWGYIYLDVRVKEVWTT